LIAATVPTGRDSYTLPPAPYYVRVDFAQACQQQFPGSHLHFMLGPVYSTPWPWECLAPADRYYPPPSLSLMSLERTGGYRATDIVADAPSSISLRLTSDPPGRAATAASAARHRLTTLAIGSRTVTHAGTYTVRVRLTGAGRSRLHRLRHLRVTFTLRIHPRDGKTKTSSTTVLLRRR
jgi:hypothetical protein